MSCFPVYIADDWEKEPDDKLEPFRNEYLSQLEKETYCEYMSIIIMPKGGMTTESVVQVS